MKSLTLGSLKCRIVGEPGDSAITVVLCHGYGATGTDLVPIAEEIVNLAPELEQQCAFIFPEAPHSLADQGMPWGLAWWPINMARLQQVMQLNDLAALTEVEPPGLREARELYFQFLQAMETDLEVPVSRCVLGGFSQGAMLTTDVTLHLPVAPAGLLIYSGTLLCAPEWRGLAGKLSGMPVVQTHGTADPILPYTAAQQLRDMLSDAGAKLNFHSFHGGHTIDQQALELTCQLLTGLTKRAG